MLAEAEGLVQQYVYIYVPTPMLTQKVDVCEKWNSGTKPKGLSVNCGGTGTALSTDLIVSSLLPDLTEQTQFTKAHVNCNTPVPVISWYPHIYARLRSEIFHLSTVSAADYFKGFHKTDQIKLELLSFLNFIS